MANSTLARPARGLLARIGNVFRAIDDVIADTRNIAAAVREIESLLALGDAELAARGLRRGDVVPKVFARYRVC